MAGYLPLGMIDCAFLIERAGDNDPYVVTWAFSTGVLEPYPVDLAQECYEATTDVLKSHLRSTEKFIGADFRVGPGGVGPIHNIRQEVIGTGGSGKQLPQNCAVLVRKGTGKGGRKNRGRFFWPSIPASEVDNNGLITPSTRTAIQTSMDDLLALYDAGGNDFFSAGMRLLHATEADPPTEIVSLDVDARIATQRRRLR